MKDISFFLHPLNSNDQLSNYLSPAKASKYHKHCSLFTHSHLTYSAHPLFLAKKIWFHKELVCPAPGSESLLI